MENHICLFPGQGSQHIGMGENLFPLYPKYMAAANSILGYDLAEVCLNNPDNCMQRTDITQPALFVVNALSYLEHVKEHGQPDVVLGHSLGEFSALFAAGAFDFETGLRIVKKRGELMAQCEKGGMAAVIGLDLGDIKNIIENHFPDLDIANINSAQQTVISGPVETIEAAADIFEEEFASYVILKVGGAFHSRYMVPAYKAFEKAMESVDFKNPEIETISNVSAQPYLKGQLPTLILQQLTHPVKWCESIEYLLEKGDCTFYEVGPKKVLTNLLAKIRRHQGKRV